MLHADELQKAKIKSHFLWRFWKAFGCRRR